MKIIIIATGREKDFSAYELVNEYIQRISHYYQVEIMYISGNDERSEHEKLRKSIDSVSESSFLISLDEKGKKISSIGLSQIIQKSSVESFKKIIFVIGGAFGLPIDIKERSNLLLSLSDMTFTHTMVRLILAEQIYRACTITKGEKYHHGS